MRDPGSSDEEALLASVDAPDRFRDVFARWAKPLLAYFHRRTFDADVSLELVAETMAIAFERRSRFDPARSSVDAWVFGIAQRELGRYRRRRSVRLRAIQRLGLEVPAVNDLSYERIDELVDAEGARHELRAAVAQLSRSEREAVRLRVVLNEPYVAVAAALGCSEGAARVRVHRGLRQLAHRLEEMDGHSRSH